MLHLSQWQRQTNQTMILFFFFYLLKLLSDWNIIVQAKGRERKRVHNRQSTNNRPTKCSLTEDGLMIGENNEKQ